MTPHAPHPITHLHRTIPLALAAVLLASPTTLPAQTPLLGADGKPLAFDAISIREDKFEPTPENPPKYGPTPDGYRLKGPPLTIVIRAAYLPTPGSDTLTFGPSQLSGIPPWLRQTQYDIDAKVSALDLPRWRDPAQQPAMMRAMLQALLADRFKLVVHRESKEIPIYELTVAKNGPKFKPSKLAPLSDIQQTNPHAANMVALDGAIVAPGPNPGQELIFGVTMPAFATFLSQLAGRPIHDKTGLTGRYDITYQAEPPPPDPGGPPPPPDDLATQMFSVLPQQLGLQLKSTKGSVESLVIDHIEPPSPN
jgi:uncharacterized protein (TIGR03435 family)